jgi:hypothetical protein
MRPIFVLSIDEFIGGSQEKVGVAESLHHQQ